MLDLGVSKIVQISANTCISRCRGSILGVMYSRYTLSKWISHVFTIYVQISLGSLTSIPFCSHIRYLRYIRITWDIYSWCVSSMIHIYSGYIHKICSPLLCSRLPLSLSLSIYLSVSCNKKKHVFRFRFILLEVWYEIII